MHRKVRADEPGDKALINVAIGGKKEYFNRDIAYVKQCKDVSFQNIHRDRRRILHLGNADGLPEEYMHESK